MADPVAFLKAAWAPLILGAAAAFAYLSVLAFTHLRIRRLLDLYRRVLELQDSHERRREREPLSALKAPMYRDLAARLRDMLLKDGLRSGPARPTPSCRA